MKSLYISDLDGTLLNRSAELSQRTVEIIRGLIASGMHFTIATARTQGTVIKMMERLPINAPMILMNGVIVYDSQEGRPVCVRYLPQNGAAALVSMLKQHEITGFLYAIEDGDVNTYYENLAAPHRRNFHDERVSKYGKRFTQVDDFRLLPVHNLVYCSLCEPYERLLPLYRDIARNSSLRCEFYRDIYLEGMWYLEIFSQKASKEEGIRFLREQYGYERVVSFGDNLNDLPLFAQSDYALAVANAKDDVKEQADEIILSNEDDGVALWLQAHNPV